MISQVSVKRILLCPKGINRSSRDHTGSSLRSTASLWVIICVNSVACFPKLEVNVWGT